MVKPPNASENVKAVARMHLLEAFKAIYNPKGIKPILDKAKSEAFRRALKDADHIREEVIDGVSYVWPSSIPF